MVNTDAIGSRRDNRELSKVRAEKYGVSTWKGVPARKSFLVPWWTLTHPRTKHTSKWRERNATRDDTLEKAMRANFLYTFYGKATLKKEPRFAIIYAKRAFLLAKQESEILH